MPKDIDDIAKPEGREGSGGDTEDAVPGSARTAEDMESDDPTDGDESGVGRARSSRAVLKRLLLGLLLIAALGLGGWFARDWWTVGRFVESTEDAYVKADIATYSAQVAGAITEIAVADNAHVRAGDVLLTIDDTSCRALLDQAEASVASAQAAIGTTDTQIALQADMIAASEADLAAAQSRLDVARTNADRSRELLTRGVATQASTDQQVLARDTAEASARAAEAALKVARGQVDVLTAQRKQQEAALAQALAALKVARQNLDKTIVRASRDGVVGNRGIDLGEFVGVGTRLISLVPLNDVYVVANFKETQVQHFRPGMAVELTSDMLGGASVSGEIDSIAPAAGSEFALLPTENATGNFTKIVQRVPVRIRIDPPAADGPSLRPGTSVVVDVDTRGAE